MMRKPFMDVLMSDQHDTFETDELAICLSHYDLGTIQAIRPFARGSRRAPKLIIDADRGTFLFKRRAPGSQSDLAKVAFTHEIQLSLASQNFPLPHLIGTRGKNNSMLIRDKTIYEMFEYIEGEDYAASTQTAYHSGHILGLFHKLLANFRTSYPAPTGSYHDASVIRQMADSLTKALLALVPKHESKVEKLVTFVMQTYNTCAQKVHTLGLTQWDRQIVHGDWHPGNMLFRNGKVVAVIDYDTARYQQRIIDMANGALQFSIQGGGPGDPRSWPVDLDMNRFCEFVHGYDKVNIVSIAEIHCIPFLMCEALIAEAVLPIAATGKFARYDGLAFIEMIAHKVSWLMKHHQDIYDALDA
jgi:Ser/Thr protein kinase RdoA (MazF antagonist)